MLHGPWTSEEVPDLQSSLRPYVQSIVSLTSSSAAPTQKTTSHPATPALVAATTIGVALVYAGKVAQRNGQTTLSKTCLTSESWVPLVAGWATPVGRGSDAGIPLAQVRGPSVLQTCFHTVPAKRSAHPWFKPRWDVNLHPVRHRVFGLSSG